MALHSTHDNENGRVKCYCGTGFGRKSELNRHVKQTHGSRKHWCPVRNCPFKTARSGKVKEHLRKKHGITEGEQRRRNTNTYRNIASSSGYSRLEDQASITQQEPIMEQPAQNTTQTFAGAASTNIILGSGQWVPDIETERLETPPRHLQLPRSTENTHPSTAPGPEEDSPLANDLLDATHMLSLGHDYGFESITSWMDTSLVDGWHLNSWRP
ncbi:hypothetical protein ACEPPN_010373 [Leptodophora sp. 'Broadleaf-Isolate-01']